MTTKNRSAEGPTNIVPTKKPFRVIGLECQFLKAVEQRSANAFQHSLMMIKHHIQNIRWNNPDPLL